MNVMLQRVKFQSQNVGLNIYLILTKYVTVKYSKVKLSRYTPWRQMRERRYSSYSFLTSATRWR
jgi:hypothetical protein